MAAAAAAAGVAGAAGATGAAGAGAPKSVEAAKIAMDLLELTRLAQTQHGLRHGDYLRYRQYCARRIQRLRHGLKLQQGKKEYRKRLPDPDKVAESADSRYLELYVFQVERAWAYAMQLKAEVTEDNPRPRHHLQRRLAKAARHADALVALCRRVASTRTQLESEAYCSWVHGNDRLEREDWPAALARFTEAKTVFAELGKASDLEQQALCNERVQQIEPSIRYCTYVLRRASGGAAGDQTELMALQERSEGDELLQRRLQTILDANRHREAESISTVMWQDQRLSVKNEKVRVALVSAQQLLDNLALQNKQQQQQQQQQQPPQPAAEQQPTNSDTDPVERQMEVYSSVLGSYDEALQALRNEIRDAEKALAKKNVVDALRLLECYLVFRKLQQTDVRNVVMSSSLVSRYIAQQQPQSQQQPQAQQTFRKVKPEELVTLFQKMEQNVDAMAETYDAGTAAVAAGTASAGAPAPAAASPGAAPVAQLERAAKRASYSALRVTFLGDSFRAVGRLAEAYALYVRADQMLQAAAAAHRQCAVPDEAALAQLSAAQQFAAQQKLAVHVASVTGADSSSAQRSRGPKTDEARALEERLSEYDPGTASTGHRLCSFPPNYVAVPGKPVFFDLAFNFVEFEDVSRRAASAQPARQASASSASPSAPSKPAAAPAGAASPAPAAGASGASAQKEQPDSQQKSGGGGWFGFLRR